MLYRLLRAIKPLRAAVRFGHKRVARYHRQVWRLEGRERASGAPLAILFAGQLQNKNYLAHLAFADSPVDQALGWRWLWALLPPVGKRESGGVDIRIIELHESQRRLLRRRFQFFVPIWIGGEVDLSCRIARLQHSRNAKADLRRMQKNETTYEVTRDPEAFEEFYLNMYLPYIKNRYGDRAFSMSHDEMVGKYECSELLFVKVRGERVAGQILLYEDDRVRAWSIGVKDGDSLYVKAGAIKALDYLLLPYLTDRGYKVLHMGASRPFLLDGALQYKRNLGVRVVDHTARYFSLSFSPGSAGAKAFVTNNPFIFQSDGAYRGALFIEPELPLSQERLQELYAEYHMDGLAGLSLFDARAGGEKELAQISAGSFDGSDSARCGREEGRPAPGRPPLDIRFLAMNLAVKLIPTGWKYWDNSILLKTPIGDKGPIRVPEGYKWTWAGPEDIEYLDRHPEATSPRAYARRAARGDRCLCIKQGSEVVGYQWVTLAACRIFNGFGPSMEMSLFPLRPGQAYSYDMYTYQKYRGRGVGTVMKGLLWHALREEGIKEVLVLVSPDNHASLRLQLRLGAQPQRMVYSYRIRSWSKTFLGPEGDRRLTEWIQRFGVRCAEDSPQGVGGPCDSDASPGRGGQGYDKAARSRPHL